MAIEKSILKGTKKILGLSENDTSFDHDVITHINSAFFELYQLGIGPPEGFAVTSEEAEWDDFVTGLNMTVLNAIQSYVFLFVRLIFDPPGTPHHIQAMKDQLQEFTYRLLMERELTVGGTPDLNPFGTVVLDGGMP